MRKIKFVTGEYYHVFNRGVDKRNIFLEEKDIARFVQSMQEFNAVDPIGSIYEAFVRKNSKKLGNKLGNLVSKNNGKLVEFICYCLNPNHYHFIIQQLVDRGVEKLMHRLGLGYSKYFNAKYKRVGSLFQGPFHAIHIDTDRYLLHASVYVNLNNRVHNIENNRFRSSWTEYISNSKKDETKHFCAKEIILNQFSDLKAYKIFAVQSLKGMRERKELEKLLKLEEL